MMMNQNTKREGTLITMWSVRTYDVWGNARDGWNVNDSWSAGEVELRIPKTRYNIGVEWHVCRNPECPGNRPCGHTPRCEGGHPCESHGVIGNPVYQYDEATHGVSSTPSHYECPECGARVETESQEFIGASPTDRQIKRALGVRCRITTDGDDTHIDVTRERDGYPLGDLMCESHVSLSPVRKR